MFVAGGLQHLGRFAGRDHERPQVHRDLQIEVLGRDVTDRLADADAGVVDEAVEPAPLTLVLGDQVDHGLHGSDVGDDRLDLEVFVG